MRELKFRAWDRVEKQFRYFNVGEFGTLYNCEDLQQFTGLNDADGKEIYEGDILRGEYYNCHVDYTKGIGVVHMGIAGDTDGYNHGNTLGWMCGDNSLLDIVSGSHWTPEVVHPECKVIGNIHENPELLTKKGDKS